MAMPLSGCIALRNCITGINCSSISCAVTGTVGPVEGSSLSGMYTCAGFLKGTPSMSSFYGYSNTKPVDFTLVRAYNNCPLYCWRCDGIITRIMNAGDCFCNTIRYDLTTDVGKTTACLTIDCNGSNIFSCSAINGVIASGSYSYTHRVGDSVCFCSYVRNLTGSALDLEVSETIFTITNIVGSYCKGTTCPTVSVFLTNPI